MTETKTSSGGIAKSIIIVIAVLGAGLGLLLLLVVMMVMPGGGGGGGGGNNNAACTPGEGDDSGVEIPSEYEELVAAAASESGFSVEVLGAQIYHESSWDPEAVSPAGAQGIAQFMPATWDDYGEGSFENSLDPEMAIAAQGKFMAYLRDFMEEHAEDDQHLLELVLAGYNAGHGAVESYDFDLDDMFNDSAAPGFGEETQPYVQNITVAAEGNYSSGCSHAGDVPSGSITDAAMHLAWDERVEIPHSSADSHGREESRPEYVPAAEGINPSHHNAYFTDCGVFVATVMITSGVDPDYPPRGTSIQRPYLAESDDYEYFIPTSEGELESGDILISDGHTYIYTGERNSTPDGRAQGASHFTRPPSGHYFALSDNTGTYHVARFIGETNGDEDDDGPITPNTP